MNEFAQESSSVENEITPTPGKDVDNGTVVKVMLQLAQQKITELTTNGIATEAKLIAQVGSQQHRIDLLQDQVDEAAKKIDNTVAMLQDKHKEELAKGSKA